MMEVKVETLTPMKPTTTQRRQLVMLALEDVVATEEQSELEFLTHLLLSQT
jgi:hypothetical protein